MARRAGTILLSVVGAAVAFTAGYALGRVCAAPLELRTTMGMVPALLCLFPSFKCFAPRATFPMWVLTVAISATIATLLQWAFG